jgi:hypothetical protein
VGSEGTVVGCVGHVIVPTRGTAGIGEILVVVRGAPETYLAWSDDPLPKGATVLVVDDRGARTVDVVPWAGPYGSSPQSP